MSYCGPQPLDRVERKTRLARFQETPEEYPSVVEEFDRNSELVHSTNKGNHWDEIS
jgi:hypothetical protein